MAADPSTSTSTSTSSASRHTYHVFLSFRGDTRLSFTDYLYTALSNAGFRTFRDENEIPGGGRIDSELRKAIEESRISVIVFSKGYASSEWCLDELLMILKRRESGHKVLPVFYNVSPSDVKNQKGVFGEGFVTCGEKFEEKVGEWRAALREVGNLKGRVLENDANGHEAEFVQKIIKEVAEELKRTVLKVANYTVGMESRVSDVDSWLKEESTEVEVGVLCGIGGGGKTTIAKVAYNLNFESFQASSFLANVIATCELPNGHILLQTQLLSDTTKGKRQKIYNSDEGIIKVQDAICRKSILAVFDDVDRVEQMDAIIGSLDSFFGGSKIIITTHCQRLLEGHKMHKTFKVKELSYDESHCLFCWHAFGKDQPPEGYMDYSDKVVRYCEGLPQALECFGSIFAGGSKEVWERSLQTLEAIPNTKIRKTLEVSYRSLPDPHDKDLFLTIASSFVGKDKDCAVKVLKENNFYSTIGIQNLIDSSLVTIDKDNKIVMKQLVQAMAKEIIRQESLQEPGKWSRLDNHRDSFSSTMERADTLAIKRPFQDERTLAVDKSLQAREKRGHLEDSSQDQFTLPFLGNSMKRRLLGFFSYFQ